MSPADAASGIICEMLPLFSLTVSTAKRRSVTNAADLSGVYIPPETEPHDANASRSIFASLKSPERPIAEEISSFSSTAVRSVEFCSRAEFSISLLMPPSENSPAILT